MLCHVNESRVTELQFASVREQTGYDMSTIVRVNKLSFKTCFSISEMSYRPLARTKTVPSFLHFLAIKKQLNIHDSDEI